MLCLELVDLHARLVFLAFSQVLENLILYPSGLRPLSCFECHCAVVNEVVNSYATIKNNTVLTFISFDNDQYKLMHMQEKQSHSGLGQRPGNLTLG